MPKMPMYVSAQVALTPALAPYDQGLNPRVMAEDMAGFAAKQLYVGHGTISPSEGRKLGSLSYNAEKSHKTSDKIIHQMWPQRNKCKLIGQRDELLEFPLQNRALKAEILAH